MVPLPELWLFDSQMAYMAPGLWAPGRVCLSQRGRKVLGERLSGGHWEGFKLGLKGNGGNSKPFHDAM